SVPAPGAPGPEPRPRRQNGPRTAGRRRPARPSSGSLVVSWIGHHPAGIRYCARMNTPKDALVISAVGLATTTFAGLSILRALRARRWQQTAGTILESDIEPIRDDSAEGGKTRYRLRVRYRYEAGGQEFTGD